MSDMASDNRNDRGPGDRTRRHGDSADGHGSHLIGLGLAPGAGGGAQLPVMLPLPLGSLSIMSHRSANTMTMPAIMDTRR